MSINHKLRSLSDRQLDIAAQYFKALGDMSRLMILRALNGSEKNVTEIASVTGLSQPNVSRHMGILAAAGIVEKTKVGVTARYRIVDTNVSVVCGLACGRTV